MITKACEKLSCKPDELSVLAFEELRFRFLLSESLCLQLA